VSGHPLVAHAGLPELTLRMRSQELLQVWRRSRRSGLQEPLPERSAPGAKVYFKELKMQSVYLAEVP